MSRYYGSFYATKSTLVTSEILKYCFKFWYLKMYKDGHSDILNNKYYLPCVKRNM